MCGRMIGWCRLERVCVYVWGGLSRFGAAVDVGGDTWSHTSTGALKSDRTGHWYFTCWAVVRVGILEGDGDTKSWASSADEGLTGTCGKDGGDGSSLLSGGVRGWDEKTRMCERLLQPSKAYCSCSSSHVLLSSSFLCSNLFSPHWCWEGLVDLFDSQWHFLERWSSMKLFFCILL